MFSKTRSVQNSKTNSKVLDSLARYGHIALVCVLMLVLALMVFPLPATLLDVLLVLNLMGVLVILMVTVSITDPMQLSSFPTLLLIGTLFRLGLNISSTRLILSQGHAGAVIQTFGSYVTGGNLAVGLILFFVLLVIQFVVITKGSERVAEVAARFTLDALPGKQMSIDADLRAGQITSEQAADKRSDLIRESRLFGAMDGAMKFVKGDALAGLVIVMINIFGGLLIGVMQKGYRLEEAWLRYTTLTVGDGLVSQIPALLMAMAAGFLVTRVVHHKHAQSLGADIGLQIFVQPYALLIVALVLFGMSLIPGLPTVLFIFCAACLAAFASYLLLQTQKEFKASEAVEQHLLNHIDSHVNVGRAYPLLLELSPQMYAYFNDDSRWQVCLNHTYPHVQAHLSRKWGVPFPQLKIAINEDLAAEHYQIKIYEVVADQGFLAAQHCMLRGAADTSETRLGPGEVRYTHTVHGTAVQLFALQHHAELEEKGFAVQSPDEVLLRHLVAVLKKNATEFIGIQEIRQILNELEKTHPELVRETVPRLISIQKLVDVVKRLVDEGLPIQDFRLILEILSGLRPESKSAVDLCECLRMGLKRLISHRYAGPSRRLHCFLIDPVIEEEILENIRKTDEGMTLAMAPDRMQVIIKAIQVFYKNHQIKESQAVILTQVEIRRCLRRMIEHDLCDVAVLSYQELESRVQIQPLDTISLYAEREAVVI